MSLRDYMPTTENVRTRLEEYAIEYSGVPRAVTSAEFDRWLAAHDAALTGKPVQVDRDTIEVLTEQHKFEMMRAKSAEAEVARLRAMIAEAAFWVEKNIGSQAAKAYMNGLAKDTAAPTFEEGNDRG